MRTILAALHEIAQSAQQTGPTGGPLGGPGGPVGPPRGFSSIDALFQLVEFVGFFLAIGAIGFRFGIVRQIRGMSDDAKAILRADNAALLGILGMALLWLAYLGQPYLNAVTDHKAFAAALPKNLSQFQWKMAMLTIGTLGFVLVRATWRGGWTIAAIGVLLLVLQPLYTGRFAGKVNAVHILAASTWLGTLLVLLLIGIRGVATSTSAAGAQRAELVADLVNSFSPLALVASAIVAITGLTTAWLHLKRISSLWTTSYGLALDVKLVLVLVVVTLGAWNWRRVRPSLGAEGTEQTIRRSAKMELTFAALVLIATSVLVTLPSPR